MLRVIILAQNPITNRKGNAIAPNSIPFRSKLYHAEAALSETIPSLMSRIPVFIIDDDVFDKITHSEYNPNSEEMPTDFLGCYIHNFDTALLKSYYPSIHFPDISGRTILLCMNRIIDVAHRLNYDESHLMSKVLIHEFGHAYMDIFEPDDFHYSDIDKIYKSNEESWANLFTISILESYYSKTDFFILGGADVLLKQAQKFISRQPDIYALGGFLWNCGIRDYNLWAYHKHKKYIWKNWIDFAMNKFKSNDMSGVLDEWNKTVDILRT